MTVINKKYLNVEKQAGLLSSVGKFVTGEGARLAEGVGEVAAGEFGSGVASALHKAFRDPKNIPGPAVAANLKPLQSLVDLHGANVGKAMKSNIVENILSSASKTEMPQLKSDIEEFLASSAASRQSWRQAARGVSGQVGQLAAGAVRDAQRAKQMERALAELPVGHPAEKMFQTKRLYESLGMSAEDAFAPLREQKFQTDIAKGVAETQKFNLEQQKLRNELAKQNTLFGRLQGSTAGQIAGPLLGGAAAVTGGLVGAKALSTLGAIGGVMGISDLPGQMVSNLAIDKIVQQTPELASIPRSVLKEYYQIIFKYAPSIAQNPRMTGILMNRLKDYGNIDQEFVTSLGKAEQSVRSGASRQMDLFSLGSGIIK